jgi:AraC-like DNA-binding protein
VTPRLQAAGRVLSLERPLLMGIVNATPDSFSDAGVHRTLDDRVKLAAELLAAGAGSVAEAAEAAGYSDATALSHAFRKQFGRAPQQWAMAAGR